MFLDNHTAILPRTMAWLKLFHLAFVILWFGAAAADVVLEFVLKQTKDRGGQLALIHLHAMVDQILEGPAIVFTLATGMMLLFLAGKWPGILTVKVIAAGGAAAANLYCVKKVVERDQWARQAGGDVPLLDSAQGRRFSTLIFATGSGIPLAVVALVIAVVYL